MNESYSHIIVIGNGFDLNLGLPTSYGHFVESDQFQKMVESTNDLAIYLNNRKNLENWIDIENELKTYSQVVDNPNFELDFTLLSNALIEYLQSIDVETADRTSHGYKLIESLIDDDILILDFNYTNTIQKTVLDWGYPVELIKNRLMKMHGTVAAKKIIFGVEDGAPVKKAHIFLKKSCNINYSSLNLSKYFLRCKEVSFFGHSLGETDHMYFSDFFLSCSNPISNRTKKLNLYHYGLKGWNEIHGQLDELTGKRVSNLKQLNTFNSINLAPLNVLSESIR